MTLKLDAKKFKLVGGDASLDFVNTVSGRISNPNKNGGGTIRIFTARTSW